MNVAAFLAILLLTFRSPQQASFIKAQAASVCELTSQPKRYSRQAVVIRAYVLSDLIHATNLVDPDCPNRGVSLDSGEWKGRPVALSKDESYHKLQELRSKMIEIQNNGEKVYGTFEGLFEWHRSKKPSYIFVLHRVSRLHVGKEDEHETRVP